MVTIAVNGAAGRMGSRILALAQEQPDRFKVVQSFDMDKMESLSPYAKGEKKLACDVLIDFSGPDGARWANAAANRSKIKGLVIGSTGLDDETMQTLKATATILPVVVSSNMSVGVNLVLEALSLLSKKLPKDFNIKITEAHHIHKKDAPSGTALMLAKEIANARSLDLTALLKSWKEGKFDEKGSGDKIGMKVIREGEVVGDHTVLFDGPAESIEIRHSAKSRDTFARGALIAAQFVCKKTKGLYTMQDVLAL